MSKDHGAGVMVHTMSHRRLSLVSHTIALVCIAILYPTVSNADWAGTTLPSADAPVLVSSDIQLFFALTNSSITNVQLTEDMVVHTSKVLWNATGGAIMRTTNVTVRGSPRPGNPYFPMLDLAWAQSLIRMPPGSTFGMFNFSIQRHTLQTCGPDLVGLSPGTFMYSENIWRKLAFLRPYEKIIQFFAGGPTWASGLGNNTFYNFTDGLCVSAPDYKCFRGLQLVSYSCDIWEPTESAIHEIQVNNPLTGYELLDDYCNVDQTPPPLACVVNFTNIMYARIYGSVPTPSTVWVTTASQLVSAMVSSTVDLVLITQDITDWTDAQTMLSGMQLPVVRGRNITIRGAALAGVYPVLDFKFTKTFLRLTNSSSLQFEQLVVTGLQAQPEPNAIGISAIEWADGDSGVLVLKDTLWNYQTCPSPDNITSQLAATTRPSLYAGAQTYSTLSSPACIQRPTTPVAPTVPVSGPNMAAFPPSSYTHCFTPAWSLQDMVLNRQTQTSNRVVLVRNSWIVCGTLSSLSSAAPTVGSSSDDTNWQLIVGLTVGLGGAAIIAVVVGLLVWRAKKNKQAAPSTTGSSSPGGFSYIMTKIGGGRHGSTDSYPSSGQTPGLLGGTTPMGSTMPSNMMTNASAQSILLELAKQTCAQPLAGPQTIKITPNTPIVEGVALDVDVSKSIVVQQVIGVGTHSVVHRGLYNGHPVALKVLAIDANATVLSTELNILGRIRDPHVVSLLGAGCSETHTYLILELCDGSMDKLIYGNEPATGPLIVDPSAFQPEPAPQARVGRQLSLELIMSVGKQVAQGLACLHPTIIHRDLKPSNILLNTATDHTSIVVSDGSKSPAAAEEKVVVGGIEMPGSMVTVKLSDFGLSRMMASVVLMTGRPAVGTLPYMAPECFKTDGVGITCKSDIYSLGVVLWEMIHGQQPWAGQDAGAILFNVLVMRNRLTFTAPENRCPPRLRALIERCWDVDPDCRPSASDVATELGLIAGGLATRTA